MVGRNTRTSNRKGRVVSRPPPPRTTLNHLCFCPWPAAGRGAGSCLSYTWSLIFVIVPEQVACPPWSHRGKPEACVLLGAVGKRRDPSRVGSYLTSLAALSGVVSSVSNLDLVLAPKAAERK